MNGAMILDSSVWHYALWLVGGLLSAVDDDQNDYCVDREHSSLQHLGL